MNSRLSSLLPIPIFAAAFVLPGCIPEHVGSQSNGSSGALQFDGTATRSQAIATGFGVIVGIERYDPQWRNCVISKSEDVGSHVASAPAFDTSLEPQDNCSGLHHEPVNLIGASCADDTCTVSPLPDDGSGTARVLVTGAHEGHTKLHVDVKSTDADSTWGDDYELTFAAPARIAITRGGSGQANARYASLPGSTFMWCPALADVAGNELASETTIFTNDAASAGDVIAVDEPYYQNDAYCATFHAHTPGTTTVHFGAGALTASRDVVVEDPNDIAKVELREFVLPAESSSDLDEVGTAEETIADVPTTSLAFYTEDFGSRIYASVLTMNDGKIVLGGGNRWQSSASTVMISGYLDGSTEADPSDITTEAIDVFVSSEAIGDGQLTAAFGSVTATVPFHILPGESPDAGTSDAGTPDGGL